jgi:hypothetical protein
MTREDDGAPFPGALASWNVDAIVTILTAVKDLMEEAEAAEKAEAAEEGETGSARHPATA